MITYGSMIRWILSLTHTPTGISVKTDSLAKRRESMQEAKARLEKRLRSRVWAEQNNIEATRETRFSYDLDRLGVDGYNDDLLQMRKEHPSLATPPGNILK